MFRRGLAGAALVALIAAALAVEWGQVARAQADKGVKKPPALATNATQVRARLAKVWSFSGYDDPKTTLAESLDQLGRIHGLKFKINAAAFAGEGLKEVGSVEIVGAGPLPRLKTTLDWVLRKVLARVPTPSGATYLVVGNTVEITTHANLQARRLRPEGPPAQTAEMRKGYAEALRQLRAGVAFTEIDDPKVTLREVLDVLSSRYGLVFDVHEPAFAAHGLRDVARTEIAARPIPALKAPLVKVLATVLQRVPLPARDPAVFVVRPDGLILITTKSVGDRFVVPAGGAAAS